VIGEPFKLPQDQQRTRPIREMVQGIVDDRGVIRVKQQCLRITGEVHGAVLLFVEVVR
jgi:hypothetical protein